MEDVFFKRFSGLSNSLTNPLSRTRILSLSITVFNLWAIVKTVQLKNSFRIVACMRSSVSRSTAAVASSKIRILVFSKSIFQIYHKPGSFQFILNWTNFNFIGQYFKDTYLIVLLLNKPAAFVQHSNFHLPLQSHGPIHQVI